MKRIALVLRVCGVLVLALSLLWVLGAQNGITGTCETCTVRLVVDFSGNAENINMTLVLEESDTALDAVNSTADVGYTVYEGMGTFIDSINSVTGTTDNYWLFFINSEFSMVGADVYVPSNGDSLLFIYMNADESAEYFG